MKVVIVWFRRDLRLEDNTALSKAISYSKQKQAGLLPIFQVDPHFVDMKYDMSQNIFLRHYLFLQMKRDKRDSICTSFILKRYICFAG
ncbi:deoxyribodipyrimidine photo-lyase [Bacillus sp. 0102A]